MQDFIYKCDTCKDVISRRTKQFFELTIKHPIQMDDRFHFCCVKCLQEYLGNDSNS